MHNQLNKNIYGTFAEYKDSNSINVYRDTQGREKSFNQNQSLNY